MTDVSRQTLEQIYADIVNSIGYKTTVGPVDKRKVADRLAGKASKVPSARLAKAAWRTAAVLTPLTPPPPPEPPEPPPPTYVKVAPRVAYAQGGSDARYCLKDFPGLRDDVAQYNADGLCLGSERSGGSPEDGIVGAREIDNRELCSLPMPGDPKLNTGSWKV